MRISKEAKEQIANCPNPHFRRTLEYIKDKFLPRWQCPHCPYFGVDASSGFTIL